MSVLGIVPDSAGYIFTSNSLCKIGTNRGSCLEETTEGLVLLDRANLPPDTKKGLPAALLEWT